jgi:hypothetical protein
VGNGRAELIDLCCPFVLIYGSTWWELRTAHSNLYSIELKNWRTFYLYCRTLREYSSFEKLF